MTQTDDALKLCPFCRGVMENRGYGAMHVGSPVCPLSGYAFTPEAWNTRADLAPDPLALPKVKALEWEDFDGRGAKAPAFYSANYLISLWNGRRQFEVSFSYPGHQTGYDGERWHDTLEAAKAAAQADYEARIMAALEPDTQPDPRVTALLEALTPSGDTKAAYAGEFSFPQYVTDEDGCETTVKIFVPWDTIKQIMAAIRARAAFNTTGGKADG